MAAISGNKMASFKIMLALLLGYATAIAWVVYADIAYNNHVPVEDFEFNGLYPIGLGLAAIITALVFDRNLKSIGFRFPQAKYFTAAIVLALVFSVIPFGLNLLLHLTGLGKTPSVYIQFIIVALPVLIVLAIGEEVMWRGLLFTEFSKLFSFSTTSLIIGLLWSLWHFPVIIHTKFIYSQYPLWFSLPMFTILVTSTSYIYCYLRKVSDSIWPCVLLHALQNWLFFTLINPLEKPVYPWSTYFMNDIGGVYVFVALAGALYYGSTNR